MSKVISENQSINAKVRSLHKKHVCSSNYQGLLLLTGEHVAQIKRIIRWT